MTQFYTKVKLYLETNSKTWEVEQDNIKLQDDGQGAYIHTWNVEGLEKPTNEQLASYETNAVIEENLENIILTRKNKYPSLNEFAEAYCEKEIGGDSTKWNAYKTAYNKVRTDNPKE